MKKNGHKRFWLLLLTLPAVALIYLGILWLTLPDVSSLIRKNPRSTSLIQFRQAEAVKRGIRFHPHISWTSLSRITPLVVQAVLIAEDDKFFQHEGFDWEALQKAMEKNIKKKRLGIGGSTITQQLAKNLYLNPSRSLLRKTREAFIAWKLEGKLSKSRILELYLNVIEWGNGIFGITAASRFYFRCSPAELTVAQSIRLASVLPNPLRFQVKANGNRRMNRKRRIIATRMLRRQLITKEQYEQALADLTSGINLH